jgi:carbamoyltransferase
MHILGISCFYHDSAAALLTDGRIVAAAQEERFTRLKNDPGFPTNAITFCLEQGGIAAGDLEYVVFYEKPLVKFDRILRNSLRTYPRSWQSFGEATIAWFDEKLWIKSIIEEQLGVDKDRILFTEHHMSHAASAFLCSPFEEAAILTVDGVGEWTTTTLGRGVADWSGEGSSSITLSREMRFPHSLGLLYSAFTAWLGFKVNEGEYKVMGMAPYGTPRYVDLIDKVVRRSDDGSFWLDMDYFTYHHSLDRSFSGKFVELFGEPRPRESEFVTRAADPNSGLATSLLDMNQHYADVAATIQWTTEEILLSMARELHRETGLSRLCVAGGAALNSVANGRLLRETPFEDVYIQPAAGDAGGALGAALYAWHVLLGRPRKHVMEHAYLGKEYSDGEIRTFLDENGIAYEHFEEEDRLVQRLVDDLLQSRVCGFFQGRFEWGPRALGNRSIIADPRSAQMKDIVNEKIKFRELFRPFAPVVPEARAAELFKDLEHPENHHALRYMLMVYDWKDGFRDKVPAVDHMGTGRLQTVKPEWNSVYNGLAEGFGQATGVPVLLNTSFNLRGEPIVSSPADAWSTFTRSGLDVLALGRYVITK